jgi:hypothetical protein
MLYAQDPELTDATGDAFVTTLPRDRGYHAQLLWPERLVPVVASPADGRKKGFDYITTDCSPARSVRIGKPMSNTADAPIWPRSMAAGSLPRIV